MAEVQIVDPDGTFLGGLGAAGRDERSFGVVAVVGCQSGGKSTLLNAAFGTRFPVLDVPKSGRRRTTLGVWAAVVSGKRERRPLVVLDVEGTDSRERGEGAKGFEAATTLFALALSDVVVINMWAHDIGRYTAAGYELFETVFAQAGGLRGEGKIFPEGKRVRVVVVVRDHDGESNVEDIRRVLMGDLRGIWDGLKIRGAEMDSLFQFDFVLLEHKIYKPEKFTRQVEELSYRFFCRRTGYFSGSNALPPKPVPISGFDALAKSVWETIIARNTGDERGKFALDLPRHAELVAHFKCAEIVFHILDDHLRERIDSLRGDIEASWRKPLLNFGARLSELVHDAFFLYDTKGASYRDIGSAFKEKRTDLAIALAEKFSEIRERHLWVCREYCMTEFEDQFRPLLGGTAEYSRTSKRLAEKYINQYKSLVNASELPAQLRCHVPAVRGIQQNSETASVPGAQLDRLGSEEDDQDREVFAVDRFRKEVVNMVEDRRRLGELLLPQGSQGGIGLADEPRKAPRWKGILIRAGILLLNYLQATHGQRVAFRAQRRHEEDFPPGPSF